MRFMEMLPTAKRMKKVSAGMTNVDALPFANAVQQQHEVNLRLKITLKLSPFHSS